MDCGTSHQIHHIRMDSFQISTSRALNHEIRPFNCTVMSLSNNFGMPRPCPRHGDDILCRYTIGLACRIGTTTMPACILERLKLSSAALNLRPALIIQFFIDCAVQPVQLVSCPVFARIPALLDEVALRLFERDARFNSN